ncbi:MAG: anthranilate phosphoribosyltransferase [Candidatus Omnitrophica bacterium]|nr:anthranilate phosphoribosyltransferase [Candidatus Omnitrophota bacterium]
METRKQMKIEDVIASLLLKISLDIKTARAVFRKIFLEKVKMQDAKTILLLLARKGETSDELEGCLSALRALEPPIHVSIPNLIDTCGTGGDQSHSLNISTLSALVIAGAGGKVAKHGNRALSSQCGSSDLMEAFGVCLDAPRDQMINSIRRYGIGYFHAPFYHPVFSRMQPLRRNLKTRTIFNLLGPLVNPLKIQGQLVGVAKREYLKLFAKVLSRSKLRRAIVCHSEDGLDEISLSAPTHIAVIENRKVRYLKIKPRQFGFHAARPKSLQGGSIQYNRAVSLAVLKGKLRGPLRNMILLNSACGLYVAGQVRNLMEGIQMAAKSIDSGQAFQALTGLKKISRHTKK